MKNYTSTVPVERTISKIEQILARAGSLSVHKEYHDGKVSALSFRLPISENKDVTIRLPADVPAVERVLLSVVKKPRKETIKRISEQAARTAWKIMLDWIEVQISMIEMHQVEALQVFLPYVWDGNKTLYAAFREGGFKMLPAGGTK
jgi:hypothetical protein